MERKLVYLKADKNIKMKSTKVYLADIAKISVEDKDLKQKLNQVLICILKPNQKRVVVSILKIIELVCARYECVEIVSLGENDVIIEYIGDKEEKRIGSLLKIIFVSLICFFGTAFTIMAFHNDINIIGLFEKIYGLFGVPYKGGAGALEIGYSMGLGTGIVVFYNHLGKRRITKDPTPLEVEMRIYEDDVNQTLIDNAEREGIELDVS